jgi:hypothetical protein
MLYLLTSEYPFSAFLSNMLVYLQTYKSTSTLFPISFGNSFVGIGSVCRNVNAPNSKILPAQFSYVGKMAAMLAAW